MLFPKKLTYWSRPHQTLNSIIIIIFFFFGVPHLATNISLFSVNQDWVFTGIDPGMAFTLFPCSIWKRQDSNPQPIDCEPSLLRVGITCAPICICCLLQNSAL